MPFFNVDGDDMARRYSAEDEHRITAARRRGDKSVRISDVQLKSGQALQFEVRFGKNAKSKKCKTPPESGMVYFQINVVETEDPNVNYRLFAPSSTGEDTVRLSSWLMWMPWSSKKGPVGLVARPTRMPYVAFSRAQHANQFTNR